MMTMNNDHDRNKQRPTTSTSRVRGSRVVDTCYFYGVLLALFLAPSAGPANAFVVPTSTSNNNYCRQQVVSSTSLPVAASSTTATTTTTDFQSCTVKELKQLIKDGPNPVERGLLSKLKRKQDFIDYLQLQQEQQSSNNDGDVAEEKEPTAPLEAQQPEAPAPVQPKQTSSRFPMKMPSLDLSDDDASDSEEPALVVEVKDNDDDAAPSAQAHARASPTNNYATNGQHKPTKKDKLFEQVFQRYPPVREGYDAIQQAEAEAAALLAASGNNTNEDDDNNGEAPLPDDIRQIHHPIFESIPSHLQSCDMDVVFVGTASCTPGTTRGVSCTALRLNWKRRATFREPTSSESSGEGGDSGNDDEKQQPPQQQNANANTGDAASSSFQGGTWLFDVGECTQLQVQRTPSIKPSKITKIFLTHAHGDHTFGLTGLLCLMGQDRDRTSNAGPIDIYGPEGLRKYLRVAIRYSVSRIVPPYRVHELKEVPMAPEWQYNTRAGRFYYKGLSTSSNNNNNNNNGQPPRQVKPWGTQGLAGEDPNSWITQSDQIHLAPSSQYGEVQGGRDIYPIYDHPQASDGAPVWEVEDEEDVKVYAAPMSHGIPCVGYVVVEASRPGRLRNELVQPMVIKNLQALKKAGLKIPMKALAVIKNLPVGSAFTFPDGSIITQDEAVEPPRKGRKVVIMGDTSSCRSMEVLAKDCDVLIHEATNAYLPGIDRDTNLRSVTRDAVIHGHSTPELAGLFAKKVNAKRLLMNHFSARYKGDPSVDSLSIMMRIEKFAMESSGLDETEVAAAWDLMLFPIRSHG